MDFASPDSSPTIDWSNQDGYESLITQRVVHNVIHDCGILNNAHQI